MKPYIFLFMTMFWGMLQAQEKMQLYDVLPNTLDTAYLKDNIPEFYKYIPENITKDKVFLILPGGGYTHHAMDHEGHQVALRLKTLGYCAFVLKYRIPAKRQQVDKRIAPIQDAQRAFVVMQQEIYKLKLQNLKFGVIGFSAGGHLASTLSTHFDTNYLPELSGGYSLRPDFSILVYPVISMEDGVTHNGSKQSLIGPDVKEEDVVRFSNEKNIKENTPPAFLIHAKDDKVVSIENSYRYTTALDRYGIKNYLFTFELGGHGFGMNNKMESKDWFREMINWIEQL